MSAKGVRILYNQKIASIERASCYTATLCDGTVLETDGGTLRLIAKGAEASTGVL